MPPAGGYRAGVTPPGWYPDPSGRFEHRYHDGDRWTADVATGGQRYVDAPGAGPATTVPAGNPRPGGNGMAIAALTCGLVGIALAWVPVLFVVGAVLAVLAIVFGVIGLGRARTRGHGRGFAVAGLVTGVAGIALAAVGAWFTVAVFRAVDRYESPQEHAIGAVTCEVDDGRVVGRGTIEHLGETATDFTLTIEVRRPSSGLVLGTSQVRVLDIDPGESREFRFSRRTDATTAACEVVRVRGPLPFGVRID